MVNKGHKFSREHNRKLSIALTGRKLSQEIKDKIGNGNLGKKVSLEGRKKISISKMGIKNPNWKGDDVKYFALHEWIRKNKIKPVVCDNCKRADKLEIANISGKYKRNIKDYKWLCRKCHFDFDFDSRQRDIKNGRFISGGTHGRR